MIYYALLAGLLATVILAVELKDLLHSVIALAGGSVILTALFLMLKAPDIAITQAVAEAGIATVIFVIAISRTRRKE
jgi:uncharacterized MnhB-related membrane protein